MNTKERLRKYVEYKGFGRNRFEKLVGISAGYLSTKSPSVGSDIIEKIVSVFHDLNIEWLVMGTGKMIVSPYVHEIDTEEKPNRKKLVHAPLVGRYARVEYINRMDDKLYLDTLPTLPVAAEGKGSYVCFEMWNDSMNDGTDKSYNPGDILICRETVCENRPRQLFFNKPKPFIAVHERDGIIVGHITSHDIEKSVIELYPLNPQYGGGAVSLQSVRKLFGILCLQRTIM